MKEYMELYVDKLQQVPQNVMEEVVAGLMEQFRERVGEEDIGSGSILDMDFNYKSTFMEHIKGVYQEVKKSAI